jgi:acyl-CoA reductase-like NAD-dependent aldehyde dehydrogenase
MTASTVYRIAKEIAHQRGLLTELETWLQGQPRSETTAEMYRYINFKRSALRAEETMLASGDVGIVEAELKTA